MDVEDVDISVPLEPASPATTMFITAGKGDSHTSPALEHRIELLLQAWMEHFDKRFEDLAVNGINGHRGPQLGHQGSQRCLQDVMKPLKEVRKSESEGAGPAVRFTEVEIHRVSSLNTREPGEDDVSEDDDGATRSQVARRTLKQSVALKGRMSVQCRLARLHERLSKAKRMKYSGISWLVHHAYFENFISVAIIINACSIGVQVDIAARMGELGDSEHGAFFISETIFLFIFLLELLLRLRGLGLKWFQSGWNLFDAALVMTQLVEFVMKFMTGWSTAGGKGSSTGRILRVFRVVRIVRVVRLLRFFVQLRMMVKMIMASLESLFWLMLLLLVIMYVVAIVFTQGVANYESTDDVASQERERFLKHYFGDIPRSILTLFTSITNGISWGLLSEQLFKLHLFFGFTFVAFLFFVFFSVLNVVTGVFVDGAIQHGGQERELLIASERKSFEGICLKLMELLVEIDTDGSGTITIDELLECANNATFSSYLAALQIYSPDVSDLFACLDRDQNGEVDIQEFIDGCLKVRGAARNIDLHALGCTISEEQKRMRARIEKTSLQLGYEISTLKDLVNGLKDYVAQIPVYVSEPWQD